MRRPSAESLNRKGEPANTALQLTNTDAAHSALRSPCLLSVLAAECHVGLSRGTTSTASVTSILVDVAEANACRRSIRRVRRAAPGSRWHFPFLKSGSCCVVQDTLFLGEPRIFGAL